jgi:hypothetical protein
VQGGAFVVSVAPCCTQVGLILLSGGLRWSLEGWDLGGWQVGTWEAGRAGSLHVWGNGGMPRAPCSTDESAMNCELHLGYTRKPNQTRQCQVMTTAAGEQPLSIADSCPVTVSPTARVRHWCGAMLGEAAYGPMRCDL